MDLNDLSENDLATLWHLYQYEQGGAEAPSISSRKLPEMEQACLIDYRVTLTSQMTEAFESFIRQCHNVPTLPRLAELRLPGLAFRGCAPPFNARLYNDKVEATVFEGGITVVLDPPDRNVEFQVEQRGAESFAAVCERAEDWVRYPQHAKLAEQYDKAETIAAFLSWFNNIAPNTTAKSAAPFVCDYLGINMDALKKEQEAMSKSPLAAAKYGTLYESLFGS